MLANGTLVFGKIVPMGGEPRLSQCFDALDRDRDFSAENFYTISTDTHIDDMVILPLVRLCGANKNVAGTVHLKTLLDQDLLVAGGNSVRNHPGRAASRGGTGGRIVSVVKDHAGVETGFPIDSFAANKVQELSTAAREIFGGTVEIEPEFLRRFQRTQGNDGKRHACGDSLDRRGVVKIGCAQVRESRNVGDIVNRAEFGVLLRHFSEGRLRWFLDEAHRHGAGVQIEPDFGRTRLATQNKSSAKRRMSGEGQFFLDSEDAHPDSATLFRRGVSGKNKSSFGEIHLTRQCLHGFRAESTAVQKNCQRVAGEGAVGEHIDLHH